MCLYVSRSFHAAGSVARVTGWDGPGNEDYSYQSWKRHLPEPSGEPPEQRQSTRPVFYCIDIIVRAPRSSDPCAIVTQLRQPLCGTDRETHDRL
jgi:hypothetical protein